MAYQAVRQAGNFIFGLLQMAIQTPAHVHLHYRSGDRHATDITMAGFTILACPQVSLMIEVNEFGLPAYADPRDWLATLPIAGQGPDRITVGGNDHVAAHTFLHGGNSGYFSVQHTGMTVQAVHTCFYMCLVAVCDRLTWGART